MAKLCNRVIDEELLMRAYTYQNCKKLVAMIPRSSGSFNDDGDDDDGDDDDGDDDDMVRISATKADDSEQA